MSIICLNLQSIFDEDYIFYLKDIKDSDEIQDYNEHPHSKLMPNTVSSKAIMLSSVVAFKCLFSGCYLVTKNRTTSELGWFTSKEFKELLDKLIDY
jgi:hypothetical protein